MEKTSESSLLEPSTKTSESSWRRLLSHHHRDPLRRLRSHHGEDFRIIITRTLYEDSEVFVEDHDDSVVIVDGLCDDAAVLHGSLVPLDFLPSFLLHFLLHLQDFSYRHLLQLLQAGTARILQAQASCKHSHPTSTPDACSTHQISVSARG